MDVAVLGGGAAGLSLVCHLARTGWRGSLVLVDDGEHPVGERAWAWWSRGDGLFDPRAAVVLRQAAVAGPGWRRRMDLAPYGYRVLPGAALAAAAEDAFASRPAWRRLRGRALRVVADDAGARVEVDTPDGRVDVRARTILDSVGPGEEAPESAALDVLGLRVRAQDPVFDPGAVTLMDFRTAQDDGVAFVYVLPASAREALVERTVFSVPGAVHDHEPHLARYLGEIGASAAAETGREHARIPLLPRPLASATRGIVPIGARAGLVRETTGYGFARIQRHSAALADALARGEDPARAAPPRRWARALDASLMRLVRDDPDGARSVLGALLRRNPPARILAFLDEEASPLAQARLFASLPEFARASLVARVRGAGAR